MTVQAIWGTIQVLIKGQDVTYFRGVPVQVDSFSSGEPFGDSVASLTFPQLTPFDTFTLGGTCSWGIPGSHVEIRHVLPDGVTTQRLWAGLLASNEQQDTQTTAGRTFHCIGAIFQADLGIKPPGFVTDSQDIGTAIANALNGYLSRDFATCAAVTTGITTRQRGGWTPIASGYVTDLLATATVSDGSNQWTVAQSNGWTPVIQLKDRTTINATITAGQPGVDTTLAIDATQSANVIYGEGIDITGCFPADTMVSADRLQQGYRYQWSGDLVHVRTAAGHELAATPNHPVLTARGWVAIGQLKQGDHLFCRAVGQGMRPGVEPDVHDVPAMIGDVVDALANVGSSEWVAGKVLQLHGDAVDSQVEVVRPERELLSHRKLLVGQVVGEPLLAGSDLDAASLTGDRTYGVRGRGLRMFLFRRHLGIPKVGCGNRIARGHASSVEHRPHRVVGDAEVRGDGVGRFARLVSAADRFLVQSFATHLALGGGYSPAVLREVNAAHRVTPSLAGGAHDAGFTQPKRDDLGGHADLVRKALGRLPSGVSTDEVVHVERQPWSGHVHNLQTGSGAYVANGIVVKNCSWRNTKYPNLRTDNAPVYPLGGGSTFVAGSATTGFQAFTDEMVKSGYAMVSGDTYATGDVAHVKDAQKRGGITVDGIVGPQTWAAVFQTGSNGYDLSGSYFAPLAYDPSVEPYLYNANGARVGANPAFVPATLRVERFENYGEGISKAEAAISARAELARTYPAGISGTITLHADPQEISRFELRAGMNIKVKLLANVDTTFHIAGVTVNLQAETATLTVDTQARDLLTLAGIRSRNKDAASDPARRASTNKRKSRNAQDQVVIFDCEAGAGIIPRHGVYGGLWTVLRIPAGQVGTIGRIIYTADTPTAATYAIGVFGSPITSNQLASLVGNPLSSTSAWRTQSDALLTAGLQISWGSSDQACGYYPNAQSDTPTPAVTGRFYDGGGFTYSTTKPPWLWVAEYSSVTTFLTGRMYVAPAY